MAKPRHCLKDYERDEADRTAMPRGVSVSRRHRTVSAVRSATTKRLQAPEASERARLRRVPATRHSPYPAHPPALPHSLGRAPVHARPRRRNRRGSPVHPLSAEWQRILLRRLDAVAVIYRLASSLARTAPRSANRLRLRWCRSGAWDAAILNDGSIIAVLRMGQTADRSAFDRRSWSLKRLRQPAAALIIAHDES